MAGTRTRMRTSLPSTFVAMLTARDAWSLRLFTAMWLSACICFWIWWWQPDHRHGWIGMTFNSLLLLYFTIFPAYFLVLVNRMRAINPNLPVPALRTAFLVTRAPSEPWSVAEYTLKAMLNQKFPHTYDVWLCDESPDIEIEQWCRIHGVRISTRAHLADYNRETWPRRTKCKEGNVAYFYDSWGYQDYEVVVQLDCDHVPSPTYLAEMLRPFCDPAIGYVAAPSLNDINAASSWSARGRLHREAAFHGPLQAGHCEGLAPSCIGSHYAVRTEALRTIGGIGPELAEDFSTSFLMTSAGWRSAFAHTAEAHGEGPITFTAMVTQEYQWARSLVTIFLDTVPDHLSRLPWILRARFVLALIYYPVLSMAMLGGLTLPVIAVVADEPWVRVGYVNFLAWWAVLELCLLGILDFLRSRGLLRPVAAPLVSWESWLYAFSRWPYIVWGVLTAVLQHWRPQRVLFRVTPKTNQGMQRLHTTVMVPYCSITMVLSVVCIWGRDRADVVGYLFLCLLGAVCYGIVSVAVPLLHARESARLNGVQLATAIRQTVDRPLMLGAASALVTLVAAFLFSAHVIVSS